MNGIRIKFSGYTFLNNTTAVRLNGDVCKRSSLQKLKRIPATALMLFSLLNCIPASADSAPIAIGGGKIGVGTTNPVTEMQVVGTVTATSFSGDGSNIANVGGLQTALVPKGAQSNEFTLDLNKIDTADFSGNVAILLPASGFTSGYENKCVLDFSLANGYTLTPPSGVKWINGLAPSSYSTVSGVRNVLTFRTRDAGNTWEGEYSIYGGLEMTFVQPTVSVDGIDASRFSVYASSLYSSSYPAYYGADHNSGTWWAAGISSGYYYIWYNPIALKVTSISFTNIPYDNYSFAGYTLYGSNDNSIWATLTTGTNNVNSANANFSLVVPSATQWFYKYYKLYISSSQSNGDPEFNQATLNATYLVSQ